MLKIFLLIALVTFPNKISTISSNLVISLILFQSFPELLYYFTRHNIEYKYSRPGTGIFNDRKNVNMISGFDPVEVIHLEYSKERMIWHCIYLRITILATY